MSVVRIILITLALTLGGEMARAEGIWNWTHDAGGSGSANVFDGGPVMFNSGRTEGPDDPILLFSAFDDTRLGSLGASYATSSFSNIITSELELIITVNFNSSYVSSLFPGGDRSGGAGEGTMWSIIEFVMPADELGFTYGYRSEQDIGFEGHATVTLENVTQSTTILSFAGEGLFADKTTLLGHAGDLIRLTSEMAGGGSAPANITVIRGYDALIRMELTIPEPATLALLLLSALVGLRRKRR